MSELIGVITASDPAHRATGRSMPSAATPRWKSCWRSAQALDRFRRSSDNLYERVRALFFLYAIHRFHIPSRPSAGGARADSLRGLCQPAEAPLRGGHRHLPGGPGGRRAERRDLERAGRRLPRAGLPDPGRPGAPQRALGARQPVDVPHRPSRRTIRCACAPSCWRATAGEPLFPILREATPVRMDLTHSGWSDIFFLGMDFPEGARVLNISIDLAVRGAGRTRPKPPVEAYFRVIDEPVLRLASVDLKASAEITTHRRGLRFRARLPGPAEGRGDRVRHRAAGHGRRHAAAGRTAGRLTGRPGHGIEIVSKVNDIPKGSRLAVSTNLLACLIAVCMRATSQIHALTGGLEEQDRRLVAARAILGEWLGGSGGGWQDSGGVWPGIKLIRACGARRAIRNSASAAGCLLPRPPDLRPARGVAGDARAAAAQPGAGAWRHGAGRRPDPGDGDREVPAALGEPSGAGGRRPSASSTRSWGT